MIFFWKLIFTLQRRRFDALNFLKFVYQFWKLLAILNELGRYFWLYSTNWEDSNDSKIGGYFQYLPHVGKAVSFYWYLQLWSKHRWYFMIVVCRIFLVHEEKTKKVILNNFFLFSKIICALCCVLKQRTILALHQWLNENKSLLCIARVSSLFFNSTHSHSFHFFKYHPIFKIFWCFSIFFNTLKESL